MAELTIGEARNNLSALLADLASGRAAEHVIKNRSVPVARIVPIAPTCDVERRVGALKDSPLAFDEDAFDELDREIAREFGL